MGMVKPQPLYLLRSIFTSIPLTNNTSKQDTGIDSSQEMGGDSDSASKFHVEFDINGEFVE